MNQPTEKQSIRRYLNGTYTTDEVDTLQQSLHQESSSDTWEELAAETWEESREEATADPKVRAEYLHEAEQLLRRLQPATHRSPYRRWFYAASGIAALFVLAWLAVSTLRYRTSTPISWMTVETSFGEKKAVTLPDGSRLVLNACTRLEYPATFQTADRSVRLAGEAYFEVTPDPDRPFRIETPHLKVKVLGTSFNVQSYAEDELMSVAVKSGKVQVDLPEAMIRLKKEEKILFQPHTGEHNKKRKEHDAVAAWTQGNLCFDHTPIQDVARCLERRFHSRISFAPGQTFTNRLTGEHDAQNLESVLESLYYISGIRYRKKADGFELYK